MVTQSWGQVTTAAPVCAPMALAAAASFPTAVTFWRASWCVCAALATKVCKHTQLLKASHVARLRHYCLHLTHHKPKQRLRAPLIGLPSLKSRP